MVVENGRQALAALAREAFDLVLMDVQMPELDGFETTAAIRERERGTPRHVPIVALTAHAMKGDAERCLAAGMDAYLAKPLQAAELVAALDRLAPDAVIDRARLLERVGGDARALAEVARIFLADAPRRLREIRRAIDDGRRARAARRGPHAEGRRLQLRGRAGPSRRRSSCRSSATPRSSTRRPRRWSGSRRSCGRCGASCGGWCR